MKYLAILSLLIACNAHAALGAGHGARVGVHAGAGVGAMGGPSSSVGAAMSGGNGGKWNWNGYMSKYDPNSIDRFQPWPQEEMGQFQKQ